MRKSLGWWGHRVPGAFEGETNIMNVDIRLNFGRPFSLVTAVVMEYFLVAIRRIGCDVVAAPRIIDLWISWIQLLEIDGGLG